MRRRVFGCSAFGVAVIVLLALAACVPIPMSPTVTVSTPGESAGTAVPPQQATATAAVVNATAQAAILQGTLDAAQATLERQLQLATEQAAQSTVQAQATAQALSREATATAAAALQLTAQAEATAQAQATLNAQAQATATELAYRSTATAQAVSREATATERAYQATTTAQALSLESTVTAVAFQATRTAAADAARVRQEAFRYGVAGVAALFALGLIAALIVGYRSLSRQGALSSAGATGSGETVVLQRGPCPPITVLSDGTVQIPMLQGLDETTCTLSQEQLAGVLDWARSGTGRAGAVMPDLSTPSLPAPGLRSIHSLRRLDQARRSGAILPDLVDALEADWEKGPEQ